MRRMVWWRVCPAAYIKGLANSAGVIAPLKRKANFLVTPAPDTALAVYQGRALVGFVVPDDDGQWSALTPDRRRLGLYATRRAALDDIDPHDACIANPCNSVVS